jgi:hypothetical protein
MINIKIFIFQFVQMSAVHHSISCVINYLSLNAANDSSTLNEAYRARGESIKLPVLQIRFRCR